MFGRRKTPFGGTASSPPSPPSGGEPFPIEKMDRALDGAIRLFTRALDNAGVDAGALAIRGAVPANVTQGLAECTTYRGQPDCSLTYLVLGLTRDFKAYMYPPHCKLYLIINSTGICEDEHAASILNQLAPGQFPGPLLDAHLMRQWIRYILPVGEALAAGGSTLEGLHDRLTTDLVAVIERIPPALADKIDRKSAFLEWADGFPGTIGRPLTDDIERMNGLPVTPFISETLTKFLADLQMLGISQRS